MRNCYACNGQGFTRERLYNGQPVEVDCKVCKTTGKLPEDDALERIATALEGILAVLEGKDGAAVKVAAQVEGVVYSGH